VTFSKKIDIKFYPESVPEPKKTIESDSIFAEGEENIELLENCIKYLK